MRTDMEDKHNMDNRWKEIWNKKGISFSVTDLGG